MLPTAILYCIAIHAKLLCQASKPIAFVSLCLGLVDDAILVGALCLLELFGTVLILILALGSQVRPLMWPGRQALKK